MLSQTVSRSAAYLELNNQGEVLRVELEREALRLGRDRRWSDLVIPEQGWEVLSRRQLIVKRDAWGHHILDGDGEHPSRNGLFVNHVRIDCQRGYLLSHGTCLTIGQNPANAIVVTYHAPTTNAPSLPPSRRHLVLRDLDQWPVVLGRAISSQYNSLTLDAPTVSRRHATLSPLAPGHYLLHNHSPNGTFVNDVTVEQTTLIKSGDVVRIGPFSLVLRNEVLELADRGDRLRLTAQGVVRRVTQGGKEQVLLDQISLAIEPGQLVALVGGSGAGKSTLMKTLLGIEPLSGGAVYLNGEDLRQHWNWYRTQIGYVPQDDIVHLNLSVEEVLRFACRLRLPPDVDETALVERTLHQVKLGHVRGTQVRCLSGGQRKRVSIAVELLADPKLFFLDEPTSGLDPGLEREMMALLRELADQGRTIVLVTHATASLAVCDRLAFLGRGGRLCYFGPPQEVTRFFGVGEGLDRLAEVYCLLDEGQTPTPLQTSIQTQVCHWRETFMRSSLYQTYVAHPLGLGNTDDEPMDPSRSRRSSLPRARHPWLRHAPQDRRPVPPWRQLWVLLQRETTLLWRDRLSLALALFTAPIGLGLITLTLRDQVPLAPLKTPDPTQVSLALSVLFVFTCASLWVGLSGSIQALVRERPIYRRERLINLRLLPYLGSKAIARLGLAIVQTLLMVGVILLGFKPPTPELLPWGLGVGITAFLTFGASFSLGLWVSSLARQESEANSALPLLLLPQIIFSGVLFVLEGQAAKVSWLMLGRWSVGAYGALVDVNRMVPQVSVPPGMPAPPAVFEVTPVYDPTWSNLALNWGLLLLHSLGCLGLTLWQLRRQD